VEKPGIIGKAIMAKKILTKPFLALYNALVGYFIGINRKLNSFSWLRAF